MRQLFYSAISLTASAAFATPALAQVPSNCAYDYAAPYHRDLPAHAVASAAGVVGGTVAGIGVSEGWWGATVAGVTPPRRNRYR